MDLLTTTTNATPIDSLETFLPYLAAFSVLGIVWMAFFAANAIRGWRVQSATLKMQKDIAEIKEHLANREAATGPSPANLQSSDSYSKNS